MTRLDGEMRRGTCEECGAVGAVAWVYADHRDHECAQLCQACIAKRRPARPSHLDPDADELEEAHRAWKEGRKPK